MKKIMGLAFWQKHVAAAKLEEGSASAYAKRHGISAKSLYYWRRKLNLPTESRSDVCQASQFVALRVADKVTWQRSSNYTLVLASGMRLEMAALPAPEWLANLAHAVQGVR